MEDSDDILLFSNEGWVHQVDYFIETQFLEKLNLKAKVICYIKNPVELINSAWWQWGAWTSTLDEYIDELLFIYQSLPKELEKWKDLIGKENLTIKLIDGDIVNNFYSFYGIKETSIAYKNNKSLKSEFLRFYQKHPELRPVKDNSKLDFILATLFAEEDGFKGTPWVLDKKSIQKILEESKQTSKLLMNLLDSESQKVLLEDSKWWDIDSFKEKEVHSSEYDTNALSYKELDFMLIKFMDKIKKLYIENLGLKSKIERIEND